VGVVHLVRHGQASWGAPDYDVLSALGEEQARVVGAALSGRGITPDVILHGAMVRQRHTAELALSSAGWGCPLVADAGWDEMDHVAALSALPDPDEVGDPDRRFTAALERWMAGAHDGDYHETFSGFGKRVHAALEAVTAHSRDSGTAVVVTSGGPIAQTASRLVDGDVSTYRKLARVVVNTSVTTLVTSPRGTSLLTFNEHAHLPLDQVTHR